MRRNPPDILITTPESLYLMLTSQAREMLTDVEAVIVDEIHAVAGTKRGAHLALTLERLAAQQEDGRDPQRIGLSRDAEPARGGRPLPGRPAARRARSSTRACASTLDLKIQVPVESMVEPEQSTRELDPLDPLAGGEATRKSIWPAIYPQILELVREHRSTIVFVNNRRGAERLALRLNELAEADIAARAPRLARARGAHGHRGDAQGGRAAVPGGDVVARARHRHGRRRPRAAGRVAEVGLARAAAHRPRRPRRRRRRRKGRIFPKFRADLLECAVVTQAHARGRRSSRPSCRATRSTCSPSRSSRSPRRARRRAGRGRRPLRAGHPHVLLRRAAARAARERARHARRALPVAGVRRPAPAHRVGPRRRHDPRAQGLARSSRSPTRARSPTAACSSSRCPTGARRRARRGDGLRGAARADVPARRVDVADRGDRPRPRDGHAGAGRAGRGAVLEGRQRRPPEGARARRSARSAAGRSSRPPRCSRRDYDLDPLAAQNLLDYLREQQEATRVVPSDRTIVVERFRDEIGDWRLCILSPFGGRVHAAWALALSARIRDDYGLESDAIWSDDGIIVHLPDADEPPGADLVLIDPDELEDLVVGELGGSALFGARFRENASRVAAHPARLPGQAHAALAAAAEGADAARGRQALRRLPDDPRDVPRVPARRARPARPATTCCARCTAASCRSSRSRRRPRRRSRRRCCSTTSRRTCTRATRRTPSGAPRRCRSTATCCASCSARRSCATSSTPTRSSRSRPTCSTAPTARAPRRATRSHDVLRRVGDLTRRRGRACACSPALDAEAMLADARAPSGARSRCASAARSAGSPPTTPACTATRSARCRRAGCPRRSSPTSRTRWSSCVARWARTHGPFTTDEVRDRYGVDLSAALARWSGRRPRARRAAPRRHEREWCDPEVLRRLRRASLAVLRKEVEAVDQRALAAFLPSWQGVDRHPPAGAGIDRLREVLVPLQGLALPADVWERDVLPRRAGAYSPTWMDQLCARARSCGSARVARAQHRPRRAVLPRGRRRCSARPAEGGARRRSPSTPGCASGSRGRRASSPTCSPRWTSRRSSSRRRCGTSSGRAR